MSPRREPGAKQAVIRAAVPVGDDLALKLDQRRDLAPFVHNLSYSRWPAASIYHDISTI